VAVAFPEDVHWPGVPAGPFVSLNAGKLQARVYRQTGHVELAGPSLAGAELANLVRLAPPAVQTAAGPALVGQLLSSQAVAGGLELRHHLGGATITARLSFPHEGVLRYEVTSWGGLALQATAVALLAKPDEHVYGFGERFITFDGLGRTFRTLTFDEPGVKTNHAYKVAPWFVSTRGYGFHLLSAFESTFDMRAAATGRFVVTNPSPGLAFQLVYGPRLLDVLTRFTAYAGRPPLPPAFTFGPWISSDIWRSGGEVRYAVTGFRKRGIPVSAFVFDSPWEIAYNDFRFNMTQFGRDATIDGEHFPGFASLAEMMQFLQSNGLKVILWITPFVNTSSADDGVPGQNLGKAANYDEGAAKGFFVRQADGTPLVLPWWKGKGSPIDFTNPAAREWVGDQLRALLKDAEVTTHSGSRQAAIGGWKTDDGESGNGPNTYIPVTARYADGRTGAEMRNAYCVEYQKAVWSVLGENGVLFARSGFIGSPATPGHWAGDNEPNFGDNGLPGVIVAGQSAAMSGYAIWGHDTGGYQDTNFSVSPRDLFMRWTQFGCFSPIMQMHRQVARELQYPWRYGDQALENFRFYAQLHTQLFPYIYSCAKQASETGLPIVRPLVLLAQDDPNTFGVRHAYRFGDVFLVAPITAPNATQRQVYLPAGGWIDFWTRRRFEGGQVVTWTDQDRTHFPLFVCEGGVVPMLLDEADTLCDPDYVTNTGLHTMTAGLHVLAIPVQDGPAFELFDGTVFRTGRGLVSITGPGRPFLLELHADAMPASVVRDGKEIAMVQTTGELDAAESAWRFDAQRRALTVKFIHTGGTTSVRS
jgi:alpha-D-xyloside xylohydrolase